MKYQLVSETNGRGLLETVLDNRNLTMEQVKKLLNAGKQEYRNPFEIENMNKAVTFFEKIYKKDLVIGLLVDEDCDGMTSSSLLYQFLINDLCHPKENIRVFLHKKAKTHGLNTTIFEDMLDSDVGLWLIADSSSNDIIQQKKLSEKNMRVIILDHHEVEHYEEVENVIIVNNQLGNPSNANLSGVGVAAQWIRGLGYSIDKYVDIIAIGLVADAMIMTDYQNKAFVNEGLNNLNNELIKEFFKDFKNPIIENISFNCANLINSVIRYGKFEEKELLWKAITNQVGVIEYKNKKGEIVQQTLQEGFVRISNNVKSRQNNAIKKAVKIIEEHIYKKGLDKDKCIIIENEDMIEVGINGIVCQRLSSKFKRPVILVSPYKDEYSGSARSPFPLKDLVNESDLVIFANGHSPAFGLSLIKENIPKLRKYLNTKLKYLNVNEKVEDVDFILNSKNLTLNQVKEIADLDALWGKGCEEPTFIIKDLTIESCKINYKKTGMCYCTQFTHNGICYKKRFCSRTVFEEIIRKQDLKFGKSQSLDLTLLVKFKKENGFYYVEIEDFNSVKSSKLNF